MATKQELIERWDSFLEKIQSRFNESLQQAEEASLELLEENNYDYYQTMQAFTGMKGQIQNLIQKIDETWEGKVCQQMKAAFENSDWVDENEKGTQLSAKLWQYLRTFEIKLEGKLSQKYYEYAIQVVDKEFCCSQCNAQLQIVKTIFRSQYITCQYCDTVNTFEPETKYSQIGWGIIDNIIKFRFLGEKQALEESYDNIKELVHFKKATEADWKAYEEQYFSYYEKYFKERIKLNSELEKRFEDDMNRKRMEFEQLKINK